MVFNPVYCVLCGARVSRESPRDHCLQWLDNIVLELVHCEDPDSFLATPLSHARLRGRSDVIPEVFDSESESFQELDSRPFKYGNDVREAFCFPAHERCFGLLQKSVKRSFASDKEHFSTLFNVLNMLPYDWHRLHWPHHYGSSDIHKYQAMTYKVETHLPKAFEYIESDPSLMPSLFEQSDTNTTDVKNSKTMEGYEEFPNIPDFLPLPPELAQQVILYLDQSDINNLQQIKSESTLDIPDIYWKQLFLSGEEMGFLDIHDTDNSVSWYQLYVQAKKVVKLGIPAVRNRQRIWKICMDVGAVVSGSLTAQPMGLERKDDNSDIEEIRNSDNLTLSVRANSREHLTYPSSFDGVDTSHFASLSDLKVTGIHVSFIGSGRMRYVSGLRFSPSEEAIGFINPQDSKYISLVSEKNLALHIAANKYGIVDISVMDNYSNRPLWLGGSDLDGAAFTRRLIQASKSGVDISKIIIGVNIFMLTALDIASPNFFIPPGDVAEEFIQNNLWAQRIPSTPYMELNLEKYYQVDVNMVDFPEKRSLCSEREKMEFDPIEYIYFGDQSLTRISCWTTGRYQDICALEFYTKEHEPKPFVVGIPTGATTDFFLDGTGGEFISDLEIMTLIENGPIMGLSVSTSYSRKFILSFIPEDTKPVISSVLTTDSGRVTGLYSRFSKRRSEFTLLSVGASSTRREEIRAVMATNTEIRPENSQLIPYDEENQGPWSDRSVTVGESWRFTSAVTLRNCKEITACMQSYHRGRLSGLFVSYDDNTQSPAFQRSTKILGQIGHCDVFSSLHLAVEDRECVTEITIYDKRAGRDRVRFVVGLKFRTSKGREEAFGVCDETEGRKLRLTKDDVLVWEYTDVGDYLEVITGP